MIVCEYATENYPIFRIYGFSTFNLFLCIVIAQYSDVLTQKQYDYLIKREGYTKQRTLIDFARTLCLSFSDTVLLCDWHKNGVGVDGKEYKFEYFILQSIFSQRKYPFIVKEYHMFSPQENSDDMRRFDTMSVIDTLVSDMEEKEGIFQKTFCCSVKVTHPASGFFSISEKPVSGDVKAVLIQRIPLPFDMYITPDSYRNPYLSAYNSVISKISDFTVANNTLICRGASFLGNFFIIFELNKGVLDFNAMNTLWNDIAFVNTSLKEKLNQMIKGSAQNKDGEQTRVVKEESKVDETPLQKLTTNPDLQMNDNQKEKSFLKTARKFLLNHHFDIVGFIVI
ncbi:MAG TPA: hypothetical protein VL201_05055, partial [Patescibacteria group bacterium]|nr:hypothetical protein [Patescibacteria group bacterium]